MAGRCCCCPLMIYFGTLKPRNQLEILLLYFKFKFVSSSYPPFHFRRGRQREEAIVWDWMFFSLQSLSSASFASLLFSEANFYELSQYASKLQHKKYLLITEDTAYILQCYIEMIPEVEVWQRWVRYRCLLLGEGRTTRKENEGSLGKWREKIIA